MKIYGFRPSERLKSRKTINQLFAEGTSMKAYPLRLLFLPHPSQLSSHPVQVSFSVPKRSFPKAVARNRIKRLMLESYRKNKSALVEQAQSGSSNLAIMFIFIGKDLPSQHLVEKGMRKILKKLHSHIEAAA